MFHTLTFKNLSVPSIALYVFLRDSTCRSSWKLNVRCSKHDATNQHIFRLSLLEYASMNCFCARLPWNYHVTTFTIISHWCNLYKVYLLLLILSDGSLLTSWLSKPTGNETIALAFASARRGSVFLIFMSSVKEVSTECGPEDDID